MEVGVSPTPRPPLPPGKTRYPFYRRMGGHQGRSGRVENLVPTGIRSQTFQSVVSCYTDWATGPTRYIVIYTKDRYLSCLGPGESNRHRRNIHFNIILFSARRCANATFQSVHQTNKCCVAVSHPTWQLYVRVVCTLLLIITVELGER